MIDLDQMEKDANKAVAQFVNKLAKKAAKDITADFEDARMRLGITYEMHAFAMTLPLVE